MYAVIDSGGKQHRVELGERLKVESLKAEPGTVVRLDKVLMVVDGSDVQIGAPHLDTAIEATVLGHGRGDKIRIFKMRRRKDMRRHAGHRQNYTELEIIRIGDAVAPIKAERAEGPKEVEPEAPAEDAVPEADDLTRINGIGPAIVEKLRGIGVTSFSQIAAFTEEDIDRVNEQLSFKGRVERDGWVEQAKQFLDESGERKLQSEE